MSYEKIGSGYYRVKYSEEQKRSQYSVPESTFEALLAAIYLRSIVREISDSYKAAKEARS